jgi:diguanylate cyclase (GGDEF)-like protein/PAS domain S-box-containing protein
MIMLRKMFGASQATFDRSSRRAALKIGIIYLVVGGLWITYSDQVIDLLTDDKKTMLKLQTYKGWLYVAATTGLLMLILRRNLRLIEKSVDEISKSRERFNLINGTLDSVFYDWDLKRNEVTRTSTLMQVFGYTLEESTSEVNWWLNKIHREDREKAQQHLKQALENGKDSFIGEYRFLHKNGTYKLVLDKGKIVRDKEGEPYRIVGSILDITERKQNEEQLRFFTYYDSLTRLPNRLFLQEELERTLSIPFPGRQKLALLVLNLDRFRGINDSLGHHAGDQLLQTVTERIKSILERECLLYRVGSDEFTLVMNRVHHIQDVAKAAQSIIDVLAQPFMIEGRELFITSSIGISLYPPDGMDITMLTRNAEIAMRRAKENGGNQYHFFEPGMNKQAMERLLLESDLRKAIVNEELSIYFQPIMDLATHQIVSMEALLRWHHPEKGLISPVAFIPIAEQTGLIVPIGEWVIRKACQQAKAWQNAEYPAIKVSVNLSVKQMNQKELVRTIQSILQEHDLDSRWLKLEITESILMADNQDTHAKLHQLRELGVEISIDDFGTGYSSLMYLQKFPIDNLKLDRSFIQNITSNKKDATIAKTLVSLAHSLDLKVVAEGVETYEQLMLLKEYKCDEIQGFLIGRPMPRIEFEKNYFMNAPWIEKLSVPVLSKGVAL